MDRYKMLLDMMKYHQTVVWGSFTAFALTHSIFLGTFAKIAIEGHKLISPKVEYGVIIASIMGLVLWLPWYVTYQRCSYYFLFRLEQAKNEEPVGLNILQGPMAELAEDGEVITEFGTYKLPWLVKKLKTRIAIPLFILCFAAIYLFFLLSQVPCIKSGIKFFF